MMGNALLMTQLMMATVEQMVRLTAVMNKAAAEGRDVTDAEIAGFRTAAVEATNRLAGLPDPATQRGGGGGGPVQPL
jgi:hypothetical protein